MPPFIERVIYHEIFERIGHKEFCSPYRNLLRTAADTSGLCAKYAFGTSIKLNADAVSFVRIIVEPHPKSILNQPSRLFSSSICSVAFTSIRLSSNRASSLHNYRVVQLTTVLLTDANSSHWNWFPEDSSIDGYYLTSRQCSAPEDHAT